MSQVPFFLHNEQQSSGFHFGSADSTLMWEHLEGKGERRIEPKRLDNAWSFCTHSGTLTPLFPLHQRIYLYWAFLLLLRAPPCHSRRGRKAGDVVTPGLKGWRFLGDVVWGQLGVWGCTWDLSVLCGLCTTALHSNGMFSAQWERWECQKSCFPRSQNRKNRLLQGGISLWACLLVFCIPETISFPLRLFIATV